MKIFLIEYKILSKTGSVIKEGKFKVKNKPNKFVAQTSFEDFMKRKHPTMERLIIISCTEDIMSMFGDMFGGSNPFSGKF